MYTLISQPVSYAPKHFLMSYVCTYIIIIIYDIESLLQAIKPIRQWNSLIRQEGCSRELCSSNVAAHLHLHTLKKERQQVILVGALNSQTQRLLAGIEPESHDHDTSTEQVCHCTDLSQ